MNSRFVVVGIRLVTGVLFASSPLLGEDLVRPGMWEIVSTMGMANKPDKSPETRLSHCYTASDLAGINARSGSLMTDSFPVPADQKCTVKDVRYVGNKGSWTTVCPNGLTIHSVMSFRGDSLEGDMDMSNSMRVHMNAKRIGDCK